MKTLFLILSLSVSSYALDPYYTGSLATMGAASFMDVHSSLGKRELNPILRSSDGRFGGKGIAIKLAIVGSYAGISYLVVRRFPKMTRFMTITNFAVAAVPAAVSINNYNNGK